MVVMPSRIFLFVLGHFPVLAGKLLEDALTSFFQVVFHLVRRADVPREIKPQFGRKQKWSLHDLTLSTESRVSVEGFESREEIDDFRGFHFLGCLGLN